MKYISETGVYSIGKCLTGDYIFAKDNAPAIPYKEEYFRKFFDVLDDILLSANQPDRIIGFHANYPENGKIMTDYGHWELLLILMLFSLIGEKIQSDTARNDLKKIFSINNAPRFEWQSINDFYCNKIADFKLNEFLQLPDEKLSALEKNLRPVAESAWEYTNCIDLGNDEKCLQVIENLLKNGYFMIVCAPDPDSSLQTAASMFGSFEKLLDTRIENLEQGWKIYA